VGGLNGKESAKGNAGGLRGRPEERGVRLVGEDRARGYRGGLGGRGDDRGGRGWKEEQRRGGNGQKSGGGRRGRGRDGNRYDNKDDNGHEDNGVYIRGGKRYNYGDYREGSDDEDIEKMNYEHAAATHPKNNVYGIDPNKFFGDSDDAKSRKKNSSKSKSLSRSRNSGSYSRSPRLLNNNLDRDYNFGDMSGIDYNAENNNQEASIDMIIPADKAMELERLRRNQEMLLERNYQRHVEEEREVRARKYNERPDYNREFKTSTRLDDKARADPKGRIAGSLSRRLQLNQSDRGGGKGNMNIYRPRTLGMNAQFEYRNQIFSGRSKFSRNRDQVNQDLQSQSIIPYEMDNNNRLSRNQEIEMNEEIQQIMSQYDYIRAMYVTYYRSFDKCKLQC